MRSRFLAVPARTGDDLAIALALAISDDEIITQTILPMIVVAVPAIEDFGVSGDAGGMMQHDVLPLAHGNVGIDGENFIGDRLRSSWMQLRNEAVRHGLRT